MKTKSIYYHTKFKLYRNRLNRLIKCCKIKYYYNDYFKSNTANIKNIWKGIKQINQMPIKCLQKY